jgi:two-component system, NarL family, invasion response regulator UvrY
LASSATATGFCHPNSEKTLTSVLVVDDHPIVLQGCRRILQDAGIEAVFEASDAETGYRVFHNNRPDVVIIDLALRESGLTGR